MSNPSIRQPLAAAVLTGLSMLATDGAVAQPAPAPRADIGYTEIRPGMTLRTLVVHNAHPKGYVLLLHGFPETAYSWKTIALELGKDYEVHAFDWPGYGLSTRPTADQFSYAPKDYAGVLRDYIRKSGIDSSKLVIYATDIGALPALLLAVDEPQVAKSIIVGDFAPFDRPAYMWAPLQSLKSLPAAEGTRGHMNKTSDEILANAYRRGLSPSEQYDIPKDVAQDWANGWSQGSMSTVDAFSNYYLHFSRDQHELEANIGKLKTRTKVIWGEKDFYIDKQMGAELAQKAGLQFTVLPGAGHYVHLQDPARTVDEVRSEFAS